VEETAGMDASLAKMYSRASRLPFSDFIQIWNAATNEEKTAITRLLLKKKNIEEREKLRKEKRRKK